MGVTRNRFTRGVCRHAVQWDRYIGMGQYVEGFVNTWIDNFGTGMMYMTGSWDEKSKVISLTGTMTDPISGKSGTRTPGSQDY